MIDEIIQEIDIIFSKIFLIHTCISFYKQLIDIKSEQEEQYNLGKNFFNSVSRGYDYVIACELPKLFSKKEEKGSIYSILSSCKEKKLLSERFIELIKDELHQCKTTIKTIKTYRDKVLAHSDKDYFKNERELLRECPFNIDEFDSLNKAAINILSEIRSKLEGCNFVFAPNMFIKYDLYAIIDKIVEE